MKTIRKKTFPDSSTPDLFDFGFGSDDVVALNQVNKVSARELDDELPMFDFHAFIQSAAVTTAPVSPETPAAVQQPKPSKLRCVAAAVKASRVRNQRNHLLSSSSIPNGPKSMDARIKANIQAVELVKQLVLENQEATEAQKETLAGYSGWGGLDRAFTSTHAAQERLSALLTEQEYASASKGTLTQHFTPDAVVDFVYAALVHLGVKPKRMLDPCVGTGLFPSRIPAQWKDDCALYAAEIDPMLAAIAGRLLPDMKLHACGFEDVRYPDDSFDLVVTNVPFSSTKTFDMEFPNGTFSLHNYFIAKSLKKVRPGGVVAVVTSAFTLSSKETLVRQTFSDTADLIAAARLPEWAFKGTAGIEVSTDVVILRKRKAGEMIPSKPRWVEADVQSEALVNSAMFDNEHWWLGQRRVVTGKHGMRWIADCAPEEFQRLSEQWVASLPKDACVLPEMDEHTQASIETQIEFEHLRSLRAGSLAEHEGGIVRMGLNGDVEPLALPESAMHRYLSYIAMRDCVKRLLLAQLKSEDDTPVNASRYELNHRYDGFVKKYGPINSRFNRSKFGEDPDYPLMSALEVFDSDTQTATKSLIMSQRTIRPRKKVTQVATAAEALMVVLNEVGKLDIPMMASLCGAPEEEIVTELKEQGRIFMNPRSMTYELADYYLSGDIGKKLDEAKFAAEDDPQFEFNVQALLTALPKRVEFKDINIQLGATFVRAEHIVQFVDYLMDNTTDVPAATVEHFPSIAKWKVKASKIEFGNDETRWGTSRMKARLLIEHALNQKTPTVRDRVVVGGVEKYVVNGDATLSAREKLAAIQEEFKTWVGRDEQRAMAIEERYNFEFNSSKPIVLNGEHLTLPGLNEAITLRASQKNSIWRNLTGGNTLVGHCVGAGKTLIGICTAMESKRLGIRRCTILTTPKSIVGQFAREFLFAYPGANLLVIEGDGGGQAKRERLLARVATGNYDAVIMSHSTFGSFGVSDKQLDDVMGPWLREITRQQAATEDRFAFKELERRKEKLEAMAKGIRHRSKSCPLTFDQLGCDAVIVDEAQSFKNLFYTTSMSSVSGLSSAFSQRAFDMFVKVRALSAQNGERGGVVFMTATPIANTVAEMFHLLRYMIMPTLMEKNIAQFDAWAANYGRTVVNAEITPDGGGYQLKTRFARFENLPELMALFSSFADIQTEEDLNLPVPKVSGGKPTVMVIKASTALKEYIQSLAKRADKIKSPNKKERPHPKDDNMLRVTTDGRLAALDMRMVGGSDEPNSKINVAVENVYKIWDEYRPTKATQLIFCDIGTPGNNRCDVYADMRDKLIAKGVPANEIAFAHDYQTPSRMQLLESRMNRGDIRITIASTELMGIGRNVQRLLIATHELDCPWRPDQVEQRGGRIKRQGNLNEVIFMFRYVVEGSFDAYNWNAIEQKFRFILQVISSKCVVRSIEDIEVRALTVAEVKALAAGNPRIIERALLQQKEAKLEALSRSFYSEQRNAQLRLAASSSNVANLQANLELVLQDVATVAANPNEDAIHVEGKAYNEPDRQAVANALQSAFANAAASISRLGMRENGLMQTAVIEVGAYRGLKLGISGSRQLDNTLGYEWCLEGHLRWGTELGNDWLGNFTRIRNLAKRLAEEADKRKLRIEQLSKAIADTESACLGTFDKAGELAETRDRLRELEIELGIAALDVQASEIDDAEVEDGEVLELEAD